MIFKTPWILALIPFVLFAVIFFTWRSRRPAFRFSSGSLVDGLKVSWRVRLQRLPFFLRLITIILFLIALAGPRSPLGETKHQALGINIVLVMDVSTSMAAEDFTLNNKRASRLDVVKNVLRDFIHKRNADRLGLIAFGSRPYTVAPLTTDHAWLIQNLERVKFGLMEDGTAIGSAVASAVNRLRDVEGRSKVVVLLTDGINNAGKIDPLSAAKAAQAKGVRVYTIGTGSRGPVPYPTVDLFGRTVYQNVQIDIDEGVLKEIARLTNASYFRATDTESLKGIYDQIDAMEKVKFEEAGYRQYQEHFDLFLLAGLFFLIVEVLLSRTIFLRIP
ncbi:MAG: VWA domain-containing protein [Candidatus Omnitrophica bacterium]|nr:VWA domain-containing protein [Candidatus Omnitrophota bacterium]